MKNVTDRTSNPFGMSPPCAHECGGTGDESGRRAVFGYGDANADFHVVGDHPGVHGGGETGIPFTGSLAGERLQPVLNEVGLLGDAYSDDPTVADLFLSYRHMCCLPEGRTPTDREYADLEPFFDSELRAISAHVLLPVGERATRYVLGTYAAREALLDAENGGGADSTDDPDGGQREDRMATLHADHVPGRGFLVVPIREPSEWDDGDGERLAASLADLLASDYRQTADLGRFLAEHDTYEVR
ncbi:uracil-DNA glycosylase family protein [Halorussus salinisoli]|uniref:uracil-DNA glycosylase family protein n=1 Tax=Halorussus salinisoli TaxID=2558242 RepID=UPI0010C1A767|nr:uracil-DNA glycosylase family protein [Halorussus salinisoli]